MNPVKIKYTAFAYNRLGIEEAYWQPQLGFKANEIILQKLYHYYQAIYLLQPTKFYWAGLARLTGGQVLYGMRKLTKICKDPSVFTQEIMWAAKNIFDSLAWQHELFLVNPTLLLQTCIEIDMEENHSFKYYHCWQLLMSNDEANVAEGNLMLLQNE